jgi:hypothetical protein
MVDLPVKHMTLYKHGVGFFERRAQLNGEEVELSFRVQEMNDVLKSLTAIDWGGGQVLGVDYATPQTQEERLAGCSIRLGDDRSLRDLLVALRGRCVRLALDQGEEATGTLLGLDELPERQPVAASLVSLLLEGSDEVAAVDLGRVQGVEILDDRGASDLRFFLETALTQDEYRQVTVRLSPGDHDLSVSYVAPAPTWRVSYRLVTETAGETTSLEEAGGGQETLPNGRGAALLQGWGIFDNRLEENLEGISLSLVAGMPISFVYDLYTPLTPERPVVEEQARVAAAPVEYDAAVERGVPGMARALMEEGAMLGAAAPKGLQATRAISREALDQASPVAASGEDLGELFQYVIDTPVTVGRGHSAMVPIVSSELECRKDLLYNGAKLATHPVATLRLENETGLTLERGPVTVIDGGQYVGEAVLSYTPPDGELVVPYAVELGAKIQEEAGSSRQTRGLSIRGSYLHFEEWDIRWREYQINNSTGEDLTVLVEHPRTPHYSLYESPKVLELASEHYRLAVSVPAGGESKLRVQERRLVRRREELRRQSYKGLQDYLRQGLIDERTQTQVAELLKLWDRIEEGEKALKEASEERQRLYKSQKQIQGNMGALSTTGKEGALRARYVDQLEASEDQLRAVGQREGELKAEIEQVKEEIEARLDALV